MWPRFSRPAIKYFLLPVGMIILYWEKAQKMLRALITELGATMRNGRSPPGTMLAWMYSHDNNEDHAYVCPESSVYMMIRTTKLGGRLYGLAAYPDCIDDLRAEIKSVLAENRGTIMNTHTPFHMKLLDSVMLESQRHKPIQMSMSTWSEAVRGRGFVPRPVTLQDGTRIPAGVHIEAPHIEITKDPVFYPDWEVKAKPNHLLLHRHANREAFRARRSIHTGSATYGATKSMEDMGFGYGQHACPWRFLAAAEIKLLLARLLLDYNVRMPEGETKCF
ncbi:hypothetical protein EKO27_g4152 [Xylaria grammica]|uniref:Cytochrome P450 n=1 Tax=Xylaria grammica TaxID=363999 RepID=A0A439D989_9PEZI|nr:hypothetical protein EKO27_g4152 [Xylaria grammica]